MAYGVPGKNGCMGLSAIHTYMNTGIILTLFCIHIAAIFLMKAGS